MKFCPQCDAKLKKSGASLACPKCDYATEGGAGAAAAAAAAAATEEATASDAFNVFEQAKNGEDEDGTLPTIETQCEKCGNNRAVWWMLQTRSADEPTTQFYRCTKCRHTWRDYS